eukprot:UN11569
MKIYSTLHTFNSFKCFIIFVRAFWRAHMGIFLGRGFSGIFSIWSISSHVC